MDAIVITSKNKLKASSLFEVLLAMVILAITFGIGMMMIYLQVLKSDKNADKLIAHKQSEAFFQKTKNEKRYFDETTAYSKGSLSKTVDVSENGLILIHIDALDGAGNTLITQNHFLVDEE